MAEEMSKRELVCSEGPQVKEVGLKNGNGMENIGRFCSL